MLKSTFYILILFVAFSACRRSNGNSTAEHICNCYDSIHNESAMSDNDEELEAKVKACNLLLTSTLDSFGKDNEKKASFMKSYRECQEK